MEAATRMLDHSSLGLLCGRSFGRQVNPITRLLRLPIHE
jgi:hypothetical protein